MASLAEEMNNLRGIRYATNALEVDKVYDKWAGSYDDHVSNLGYVGNKNMAQHSMRYTTKDESVLMLDVAAGTGLTAEAFRKEGFKGTIDAIDINAPMLKEAESKRIYRKIFCHAISEQEPLPLDDVKYDIAVIGGALFSNHLPQRSLGRIVDALKIGGFLIYNCRNVGGNEQYLQDLEDAMNNLVNAGKVAMVERKILPYFIPHNEDGKSVASSSQLCFYKRL